jgi:hypothetical protein
LPESSALPARAARSYEALMKRSTGLWIAIAGAILCTAALMGALGWYGYQRYHERIAQQKERDKRDEETARKVTTESTHDATEDLVDEDFQIRVKWPGAGFKVMAEEDARRIVPEAIGGVIGTGGDARCSLAVTAEHLPGTAPEQAARLYIEAMTAGSKTTTRFEPREFQGLDAVFFDVAGTIQGLSLTWYEVVVVRDGWVLRGMAWTNPINPGPCDRFLTDNLRFLPGTVKGRVRKTRIAEEAHPAYRVVGRRFEAPYARLAADVPDDIDLMVGDRLFTVDPEGLVGFASQSINVMIGVKRLGGVDGARYSQDVVQGISAALGPIDANAPPTQVQVLDRTITLRRLDGPPPFQTWFGASVENDREITVRILYPKAVADHALVAARRILSGVSTMSEADAARISSELPKVEPMRSARVGRALRSGALLDFAAGFRFQVPPGAGVVSLEPSLFGLGEQVAMVVIRPEEGVTAAVVSHVAGADLALDQRATISALVALPVEQIQLAPASGGAPGASRVTSDYLTVARVPSRYDVHTFSRGGVRVHVAVWGPLANVERAKSDIAGWARGLSLAENAIAEESMTPARIENVRFGFALDLPDGGWNVKPMPIGGFGSSSTVFAAYQAEGSAGSIAVMAIDPGQTGDASMIEQLVEQGVAKPGSAGTPDKREEIELGSRRARHLVWSTGMEAVLLHEGTTIFAVLVEPSRVGGVAPRKVFEALRILP